MKKDEIKKIITSAKRKLGLLPEGKLKIEEKNNGQYMVFNEERGRWEYWPKGQREYVAQLAQRNYEEKVLKEAEKQLRLMGFAEKLNARFLIDIYDKLSESRQKLIKPYEISDKEYVRLWLNKPYKQNPKEKSKAYKTINGEIVRSKSEAMIANELKEMKIPYKYEKEIEVGGYRMYPDFTLLDIRTRKEVLYEHFGMMDSVEYANNAVLKIRRYAQNGYVLGKNLLASFETSESPLDMGYVEKMLSCYFTEARPPMEVSL